MPTESDMRAMWTANFGTEYQIPSVWNWEYKNDGTTSYWRLYAYHWETGTNLPTTGPYACGIGV